MKRIAQPSITVQLVLLLLFLFSVDITMRCFSARAKEIKEIVLCPWKR